MASRAGRGLAAEIERRLPLAETVGDARALALWRRLGWAEANTDGVAGWLEAQEAARQ